MGTFSGDKHIRLYKYTRDTKIAFIAIIIKYHGLYRFPNATTIEISVSFGRECGYTFIGRAANVCR